MATTPEGKVKRIIDKELARLGVWWFNPQMGAFGKAGVPDKIICANGKFIGVEAKADRTKKPTALQKQCMKKIEAAGGKCFVVCDDASLQEMVRYIEECL